VDAVLEGGRPEPAVEVEADVVEPAAVAADEDPVAAEGAVRADVEDPDVPGPAVVDVEPPFVAGEDQSVRPLEAVGGEPDLTAVRVDPVDVVLETFFERPPKP
jgi:hypothetical protein